MYFNYIIPQFSVIILSVVVMFFSNFFITVPVLLTKKLLINETKLRFLSYQIDIALGILLKALTKKKETNSENK